VIECTHFPYTMVRQMTKLGHTFIIHYSMYCNPDVMNKFDSMSSCLRQNRLQTKLLGLFGRPPSQ